MGKSPIVKKKIVKITISFVIKFSYLADFKATLTPFSEVI